MENRGRIVTRQMLLEKVWGYDFEGEHQTISVHVVGCVRRSRSIQQATRGTSSPVRSRGYMFRE